MFGFSESDDEDGAVATLDSQGRIWGTSDIGLDFATRSSDAALRPLTDAAFTDLLRDCRLVDGPTLPDTFWLGANARPRTRLEQLAREVFEWHTAGCSAEEGFDRESSGAEWWVQIREHAAAAAGGGQRAGVAPHWDKDENLRRDFGIWAHPQLSTVTYLTGGGAPTVVLRKCIDRHGGDIIAAAPADGVGTAGAIDAAVISQPVPGKHLVFDGRLLHLVAPELTASAAVSSQSRWRSRGGASAGNDNAAAAA
eukprot:COSAG02_NODE_12548_length_1527_cov_1.619748_1_plen_252_part_01